MKLNFQDIGGVGSGGQVSATVINGAIIVPAKEAFRQIRQVLTGNLTIRDNQYAAIVTLGYQGNSTQTCTSGTEYTFQNPLKTKPIGFTPLVAVNASGTAMAISSYQLNRSRTDGLVGITIRFGWEGPYTELQPTANQTITNIANFPVTWTQSLTDATGVITLASNSSGPATTRVVVSDPGIYQFSGSIYWNETNTAGLREHFFAKNASYTGTSSTYDSIEHRGESDYVANVSGGANALPSVLTLCEWPLSAGDYVELVVFQNSGGSRTLDGTDVYRCKLRVRRVGTYGNTGLVTGILWGG